MLSSLIASATHQHIRFMLKQQAATTCTERKQLPMNDYSGWDKASSLVDVGVTMFGRTLMLVLQTRPYSQCDHGWDKASTRGLGACCAALKLSAQAGSRQPRRYPCGNAMLLALAASSRATGKTWSRTPDPCQYGTRHTWHGRMPLKSHWQ